MQNVSRETKKREKHAKISKKPKIIAKFSENSLISTIYMVKSILDFVSCETIKKRVDFLAKVIAVANQKGGVGKTTSAVNIAAGLGCNNKKTLLIDVDPQGNATSGVGIDKRAVRFSTYDLLVSGAKAQDTIIQTAYQNLFVMPSGIDLAAAELEMMDMEQRSYIMKNAIAPIKTQFDYIVIDCPPSLGLITTNALTVADTILVPIQCEYYALEGLSQLMNTVRRVKRQSNPHIELEGVLLTMYDGRLNLTQQVVNEVKRFFPQKVFSTVIPRGVRVSEAPSYGMPIMYYDKSCKGAHAYMDLVAEILKKEKRYG